MHASDELTAFGLILGTIIALTGIALAYFIWVLHPGTSERIRLRVKPLYTFSFNKWYFDEIIDFLIVRPAKRAGGIAGSVVERGFIDKGITGGANGAVKAGSTAVRAVQTGYLRYYAALIVIGMVAVDRLVPHPNVTVHLSILIFLPFAAALIGLLLPATLVRVVAIAGTVLALAYAIVAVADFDSGTAGLQFVTERPVDPLAGHPLEARHRRAEPLPDPAHVRPVDREHGVGVAARVGAPAALLLPHGPRRRPPCSAR